MDLETVRDLCLSLPHTAEVDHFSKPSYSVMKKIFATLWLDEKKIVVKLSPASQADYCDNRPQIYSPIKGYWGKKGWTEVNLSKITSKKEIEMVQQTAWSNVAPKSTKSTHKK